MVKNGDESHATIRKKSPSKQIQVRRDSTPPERIQKNLKITPTWEKTTKSDNTHTCHDFAKTTGCEIIRWHIISFLKQQKLGPKLIWGEILGFEFRCLEQDWSKSQHYSPANCGESTLLLLALHQVLFLPGQWWLITPSEGRLFPLGGVGIVPLDVHYLWEFMLRAQFFRTVFNLLRLDSVIGTMVGTPLGWGPLIFSTPIFSILSGYFQVIHLLITEVTPTNKLRFQYSLLWWKTIFRELINIFQTSIKIRCFNFQGPWWLITPS